MSYAKDGQSVERRFAEDMDLADEVCVYAKLPKGFSIPTPVGNYSPDMTEAELIFTYSDVFKGKEKPDLYKEIESLNIHKTISIICELIPPPICF
ncbi:MAG: hypothetical protein LUD18_13755 [Lachnospiraceae bacterium]|nr:hypothetical protein [Lachnospiraceae bacterium]